MLICTLCKHSQCLSFHLYSFLTLVLTFNCWICFEFLLGTNKVLWIQFNWTVSSVYTFPDIDYGLDYFLSSLGSVRQCQTQQPAEVSLHVAKLLIAAAAAGAGLFSWLQHFQDLGVFVWPSTKACGLVARQARSTAACVYRQARGMTGAPVG